MAFFVALYFTVMMTIEDFLAATLTNYEELEFLASDSAQRRFYRVYSAGQSYMAVADQTPEHYIQLSTGFSQAGINVPEIVEYDWDNGFLLLSDLGSENLVQMLAIAPQKWLPICLAQLFDLQQRGGQHILELPTYDNATFLSELSTFSEWFVTELLGDKLSIGEEAQVNDLQRLLIDAAINQPQVWVHRNFHSQHLLPVNETQLGIVGFQEAMLGPITYDVASILKDRYVRHPKAIVAEQLQHYYLSLVGHDRYFQDFSQFERDVDYMALLQQLTLLGAIAKSSLVNQQPAECNDLLLPLEYLYEILAKYPELHGYIPLFKRLGERLESEVLS